MKDLITDAVSKKISSTLEGLGGAQALYGDPVTLDGEELIPVARVRVELSSAADGEGGGDTAGGLSALAKGSGGGNASAGVQIHIEPLGVIRSGKNGPEFAPLRGAVDGTQ